MLKKKPKIKKKLKLKKNFKIRPKKEGKIGFFQKRGLKQGFFQYQFKEGDFQH